MDERLAELLESLKSSKERKDVSFDIDVIKQYMDKPRLVGLQHGDVLQQVPGLDGEYSMTCNGRPVVFDRYLTEAEKLALWSQKGGSGALILEDIIICDQVRANAAITFAVNSSRFKKVE